MKGNSNNESMYVVFDIGIGMLCDGGCVKIPASLDYVWVRF